MKLLKFLCSILSITVFTFSCSNSDSQPEEVALKEVTHNVIYWEFTPDTGNNTSRLRYEIEFQNPNDVAINGFYRITQNADGFVTTLFSSNKSPCYEIEANSTCTLSFDEEDSHDLGKLNSINLISVEYNIEEK
ncbi:hypothetical protein [Aestuariivivens insulae]|uniref:hypothetical protein n=1 Tax=Aestuariivivens insulae TaxID=1621988 RepID=UPI001F55EFD6|nr:hypothetical protein [Aestuariivivens insulae]